MSEKCDTIKSECEIVKVKYEANSIKVYKNIINKSVRRLYSRRFDLSKP